MINWIKNLFKEKPKDISEPVLSFVECVRQNPKRFQINVVIEDPFCYLYSCFDKEKGIIHWMASYKNKECFLTIDEKIYIRSELTKIYKSGPERKERYIKLKKMRKDRDERNRLKKIYCN